MKATSSAPQLNGSNPEPQNDACASRSEPFTAAPLLIVPPTVEGPGMVPSTPTTLIDAPAAFLNPFTRNRLIWFPGADSVKSCPRSPHAESSSAFSATPNFVLAQEGRS